MCACACGFGSELGRSHGRDCIVRLDGRTDAIQKDVVRELRKLGCVVEVTSRLGGGFPDLVIKTPKGTVYLVELKDGPKPLGEAQVTFGRRWGASYVVVRSVREAIALART